MSVLLDSATRVVIQGITGKMATWVLQDLRRYGTNVVAGVVPGRGGMTHEGVAVYDTVAAARAATGADASLVFVPPSGARDAVGEALDADLELVVYPGDGLPLADAVQMRRQAQRKNAVLIGPNTPGLISPGRAKIGFMPSYCYVPGPIGVISKSGSLSYEACRRLTMAGLGQSTVIGVGGDPVKGLTIGESLRLFHDDDQTRAMLVLGEIGGLEEYQLADYASAPGAKPCAAFLVGRTAPPGRQLGHAAALIGGPAEGYDAKTQALRASGVRVAPQLKDVVEAVRDAVQSAVAVTP